MPADGLTKVLSKARLDQFVYQYNLINVSKDVEAPKDVKAPKDVDA